MRIVGRCCAVSKTSLPCSNRNTRPNANRAPFRHDLAKQVPIARGDAELREKDADTHTEVLIQRQQISTPPSSSSSSSSSSSFSSPMRRHQDTSNTPLPRQIQQTSQPINVCRAPCFDGAKVRVRCGPCPLFPVLRPGCACSSSSTS